MRFLVGSIISLLAAAISLTSGNCCNKRLVTNQCAKKTAVKTRQSLVADGNHVAWANCVATAAGMAVAERDVSVEAMAGMAAADTAAAMTFLRTCGDCPSRAM